MGRSRTEQRDAEAIFFIHTHVAHLAASLHQCKSLRAILVDEEELGFQLLGDASRAKGAIQSSQIGGSRH